MQSIFLLLFLLLLITPVSATVRVRAAEDPVQPRIDLACSFLQSLYNSTLGLVRERPSYNIYHIASDNILAENALARCPSSSARSMSQSISNAIKDCCGTGYNGKHEAAFGAAINLPIHDVLTPSIRNGSGYQIVTEVRNDTSKAAVCTKGDANASYGDVTAYTVLELVRENNQSSAQATMSCLNSLYDGNGIVDNPYGTSGQYQTFKNALYLLALASMKQSPPGALVENIVRMQGVDGGIHSGYDRYGTYNGTQENAETTSMVILAFSPMRFSWPFWWILIGGFIWLAIPTVLVVIVLLRESRRNKTLVNPAS